MFTLLLRPALKIEDHELKRYKLCTRAIDR